MVALSAPESGDRYLNLACGSGTLLVERLALGPARLAVGCDMATAPLDCARANLRAAGLPGAALLQADVGRLPFADASFDALTADLPFGRLVGSHSDNLALYPRLLAEATRVAAPGARLLLITHEAQLMESALAAALAGRLAPRRDPARHAALRRGRAQPAHLHPAPGLSGGLP